MEGMMTVKWEYWPKPVCAEQYDLVPHQPISESASVTNMLQAVRLLSDLQAKYKERLRFVYVTMKLL